VASYKCYVFCLSVFVTLWNDEVCNNGNAMKQCNFQNNYGVIAYTGRFIIVHLYSTISVDPRIFPWGKTYTKNYHFARFWRL